MISGKLDSHLEKDKVDPIPHTIHQDKPQMNKNLNVKNNTSIQKK